MNMEIVYEDQYVIVVKKPPGIPSQKDLSGIKAVTEHIAEYLGHDYIALVHRLDRPVGGLMVLGKSEFSGRKLARSIAERRFEKLYLAVVCGEAKDKDELRGYLLKDGRQNISKAVPAGTKGAKEAVLSYECMDKKTGNNEELSLIKIELTTGRHHQIRVQLAQAGLPVWGDKKYNRNFMQHSQFTRLALWAEQLTFEHPKTEKKMTFRADPWEDYPFSLFQK